MAGELPDFHLPHAEKIEWMIETDGYALEVVAPDPAADPPQAGYSYTSASRRTSGSPTSSCSGWHRSPPVA